uniref:AMP-binding domain-containing protein n=1 Tax=Loa loa TaxID=7209 RepID=A0A1I7VN54_LOALO
MGDRGCPVCRSAPIAHELSGFNMSIAAVSEVRLHEEGSLKESGKYKTDLSRVGFMTTDSIISKLRNFPKFRIVRRKRCWNVREVTGSDSRRPI